ncbi:hypothetical protein HU147_14150 [Planomicrobium chinense]|uniref:Uncharacterized protein n=1 Tax=Planococcus liqunii TaxID=3058394 RepID=A0ABT8MLZ4_9BACL|nr:MULTISPECIES: hypothetical protein [Planococcus]MCP2033035.1 hypothetical protein [Planomicrobium sp. HSC-17F08]KOF11175.1 hypothetical protein AC739_04830 [Planococcus glaciei]MBX0313811.1 hypothetical protein [Planococcus glaciei]MBZ5202366.1 hypothetical protein [Planococcus chinensis]MDN7225904.1 hypothetical protein [Planococcus sp. N064]
MKKFVIQYFLEKGLTVERTVEAESRENVAAMALSENIVQFEDVFGELNIFNKTDIKLVKIKNYTEPVTTSRRGG